MSKYKELIYICIDLAKTISDDSVINEGHVMFLLHKYRSSLLAQKYANSSGHIAASNYQTICIDLEKVEYSPECQDKCLFTDGGDKYLRSIREIPSVMSIGNPRLVGEGMLRSIFTIVPIERMDTVGYSSWLKNIIYGAFGYDKHLYLKSGNLNFMDEERVYLSAVFEDPVAANEMTHCEGDGNCGCNADCDIYERDFPIEESLQAQLIALVIRDVVGASMRPKDAANNAQDDLANLVAYINTALKDRYSKAALGALKENNE